MLLLFSPVALGVALSAAIASAVGTDTQASLLNKADLRVPACPSTATVSFDRSIPELAACPLTTVDLCYTATVLSLVFTAYNETYYYFDPSHTTNGDIWKYEVMEVFISKGTEDPQTYLEYEVSPNNVTYNAFMFNPSRVLSEGAPFDHAYIHDPFADGFSITTTLDKPNQKWTSHSSIPLALFNEENPRGTKWRMNFFRIIAGPATLPSQQLCGWKNTGKASFHVTPVFGNVAFV